MAITQFSPEDIATAKRLRGLPPAEYQQGLYDYMSQGGSFGKLLALKSILDKEEAEAKARQTMQMAEQAGGNPLPQTTVMQDQLAELAQLQRSQGVAGLPMREGMYSHLEEGGPTVHAAGGGIVAFAEGGDLSDQEGGEFYALRPKEDNKPTKSPLEYLMSGVRAAYTNPAAGYQLFGAPIPQRISSFGSTPSAAVAASEYGPTLTPGIPNALAPRTGVAAKIDRGPAVSVRDDEMGAINKRLSELDAATAEKERKLEEASGNRPTVLTPEEAQAQARKEREDALKQAGMKSYKERIDELSTQAKTLDRDRDTDRWLALAQGFFAMGAGKSRYALQNMSEGLGVTTTQLRDAEKEYRKGVQAQKDRAALLQEAERKEVLGDVSAGRELRKDALRAQERFDDTQIRIRSTLLGKAEAERTALAKEKESLLTRREIAANTAAVKSAAGKLGLDARMLQELEAAGDDPQKRAAVVNKYKTITQTLQPQRYEKPEDPMMAALMKGGTGGTLTKGSDGLLTYVPGKQ